MNILDSPVSIFADHKTSNNPKTVTMRHFLTSTKYRAEVERVRATDDKAELNRLKATLPAITPSGVFLYRAVGSLVKHSGLICLDIDYKGNEAIGNFFELKEQLVKIPNVAFCALSVSGKGYAVGIPIAYPERHGQHFDALKRIFWENENIGLVVDKACRDVTRLRYYSYDPDVYFNENAKVFALYDEPKKTLTKYAQRSTVSYPQQNDPLEACLKIIQNSNEGERHNALLKASRLAGGYIAAGLLDEAYAVDELENEFGRREFDRHYKPLKTIRDGITHGKQAPINEQKTPPQPLGYPPQWCDPAPVGYVPQCTVLTPESWGLAEATTPPITENELINIFENNKHLQK